VNRILIVKTGAAPDPIRSCRGDYEDWIAAGMGVARDDVDVFSVHEGASLPDPERPAGVVVTGSAAMVTSREPWSERTAEWLAEAVRAGSFVLGICYGHQLLAHGLGGRVGPNPCGREMGTVKLDWLPGARADPLFGVLDGASLVHTTHVECVLELPPGARRLAATRRDPNQAFSLGPRAWGVQFHPEFDAEVMRGYIDARSDELRREGLDAAALRDAVEETRGGTRLLRRFAALLARQLRGARDR
jgi:GMP synthase (glutamine-hydrolysing)